jgi:hypothetical protein
MLLDQPVLWVDPPGERTGKGEADNISLKPIPQNLSSEPGSLPIITIPDSPFRPGGSQADPKPILSTEPAGMPPKKSRTVPKKPTTGETDSGTPKPCACDLSEPSGLTIPTLPILNDLVMKSEDDRKAAKWNFPAVEPRPMGLNSKFPKTYPPSKCKMDRVLLRPPQPSVEPGAMPLYDLTSKPDRCIKTKVDKIAPRPE